MRYAILALLLMVSSAYADNTSTPTKPFTFTPGTTILSSQINSDFDTLYTGLANVGTANLLANAVTTVKIQDAQVTTAKLATATQQGLVPTGTVLDYIGTTAPSGYVLADGRTLGSATSGADNASADNSALFILLYTSMADAQAPVSGGRSGSGAAAAAADFGNNKRITLPDLRGRVVAMTDYSVNGSLALRLTSGAGGVAGSTNGAAGATQTVTLTTTQLPAHTHTIGSVSHTHAMHQSSGFQAGAGATALTPNGADPTAGGCDAANGAAANTGSSGTGTAFTQVQPTMVLYKIIKL